MKKILLICLALTIASGLYGCTKQSTSSNTDDAESAVLDSTGASIPAPPVPAEPTQPAR